MQALRAGDEAAFMTLVERYQGAMIRLARVHVSDRAVAEDVTQDAWLGVLRGVQRFEGRSSFRTWLFTILVNTAKKRANTVTRLCQKFHSRSKSTASHRNAPQLMLSQAVGLSDWSLRLHRI